MFATVAEIAEIAPLAFVVGLAVGFYVGARFRIEKRSED
jgi:hypothetical protein